ncbi:MAG: aminopeptidase [Clostridiales bacterium]|jgi:aminopeptidase|nr:aminopeptidase [Clostridiales bacterium]
MKEKLQKYARLLIEVGLNIQKGQNLMISAPIECAEFARMCASAAYDVGCREVIMNWKDDLSDRLKYLKAADDVFDTYPEWRKEMLTEHAKGGGALLNIYATDPENMAGVDHDRLVRSERSAGLALEEYRQLQMSNTVPWCVASVPIPSWAAKVFPDAEPDDAIDLLWDAIFNAVRVTDDTDAVEEWRNHIDQLTIRKDRLNELNLKSLNYKNSLGTDLVVELPEGHIWAAGSESTKSGQVFVANIPTEEIFTAPKRDGVNGVIVSSMPFVKDGNIIENFKMTLKDGKIVDVQADKGVEVLRNAIAVDEGASYLGEVALVPYDSPISNTKILFYNTLFDENASCHFAFGQAYPSSIKGGENMSKGELDRRGINDSITHEDFMVGTEDLSIIGITQDGKQIPIFVDGNFAF